MKKVGFWLVFLLSFQGLFEAPKAHAQTPDDHAEPSCLLGPSWNKLLKRFHTFSAKTFVPDTASRLRQDLVAQVLSATETQSIDEAFQSADFKTLYKIQFTDRKLPAPYYTAIYYYVGNTLHGKIFERERARPVAKVRDRKIMDCAVR